MIAGETVDLYDWAGHPVGEVVEGVPAVRLEVIANVRGGVVARAGQAHPVKVGSMHPLLPRACKQTQNIKQSMAW